METTSFVINSVVFTLAMACSALAVIYANYLAVFGWLGVMCYILEYYYQMYSAQREIDTLTRRLELLCEG